MVEEIYEFKKGDLVTALFFDRRKNEFKWRLGLALKREKVHKRDRDDQKRWKICWGKDPLYTLVDFRIMCEFFRITSTEVIEDITTYHDANRSLINSTTMSFAGGYGQISNPMRDDMLGADVRERIVSAVSSFPEPVERAQLEIDTILNEVLS